METDWLNAKKTTKSHPQERICTCIFKSILMKHVLKVITSIVCHQKCLEHLLRHEQQCRSCWRNNKEENLCVMSYFCVSHVCWRGFGSRIMKRRVKEYQGSRVSWQFLFLACWPLLLLMQSQHLQEIAFKNLLSRRILRVKKAILNLFHKKTELETHLFCAKSDKEVIEGSNFMQSPDKKTMMRWSRDDKKKIAIEFPSLRNDYN